MTLTTALDPNPKSEARNPKETRSSKLEIKPKTQDAHDDP